MSEKPNSCGSCGDPVTVGAQCAVCDVWYHTNRKKNCMSRPSQEIVPYICDGCHSALNLGSSSFGEPFEQAASAPATRFGSGGRGQGSKGAPAPRQRSGIAGFAILHEKQMAERRMRQGASDTPNHLKRNMLGGSLLLQEGETTFNVDARGAAAGRAKQTTPGQPAFHQDPAQKLKETAGQISKYRRQAKKLRGADELREEYEDQQDDDTGEGNNEGEDESSTFGDTPDKSVRESGSPFESLPGSPRHRTRSGFGVGRTGPDAKRRIPLSHYEEAREDEVALADVEQQMALNPTGPGDGGAADKGDIFYQKNLADRHTQVIYSHRQMYHRAGVTDHLHPVVPLAPPAGRTTPTTSNLKPHTSSLSQGDASGAGGVNTAPARISIVEEIPPV